MCAVVKDREYWEARAARYGRAAVGYSHPAYYWYEETLRWAAIRRISKIAPGMTALDLGCGYGRYSVLLAELGCEVTGVDLSARLIELAEPHPGVTYLVGAAQNLALPSSHFDLVLSVTVLGFITDEADFQNAMINLARMLKPGGQAVVLEYSPMRPPPVPPQVTYQRYMSYQQWIDAFAAVGLRLENVTGVRYLGHGKVAPAIRRITDVFRRPPAGSVDPESSRGTFAQAPAIANVAAAVDLALVRVPLVNRLSDVHAFVFGKSASHTSPPQLRK